MAHKLRFRRTSSGCLVACRKSIHVPQRSPMAAALASLSADAHHVHWTHSTPTHQHYSVTSRGMSWLRDLMAQTAEADALAAEALAVRRSAYAHDTRHVLQVAA